MPETSLKSRGKLVMSSFIKKFGPLSYYHCSRSLRSLYYLYCSAFGLALVFFARTESARFFSELLGILYQVFPNSVSTHPPDYGGGDPAFGR